MKNSLLNHQPESVKLSRMNREISVMLKELNSYLCEPSTPDMYERYLKLNTNGIALKNKVKNIKLQFSSINQKISSEIPEEQIEHVYIKFLKFQKKITAYKNEACVCH